jgi:hypothetical protein
MLARALANRLRRAILHFWSDVRQRFFRRAEGLATSTECNAYEQVIHRRAKLVEVLRRDGAHPPWVQPRLVHQHLLSMGYIEERTVNMKDSVIVVTQAGRMALGFRT